MQYCASVAAVRSSEEFLHQPTTDDSMSRFSCHQSRARNGNNIAVWFIETVHHEKMLSKIPAELALFFVEKRTRHNKIIRHQLHCVACVMSFSWFILSSTIVLDQWAHKKFDGKNSLTLGCFNKWGIFFFSEHTGWKLIQIHPKNSSNTVRISPFFVVHVYILCT